MLNNSEVARHADTLADWQIILLVASYSWISVCNVILIIVILTNRTIRKKKSARLILNQSIADFLVGLNGIILELAQAFVIPDKENSSLEKTRQYLCLLADYFQGTFLLCSIIMMFVINLERYLFICHSFWYRAKMRFRHIFYMAGLAWLASALSAIPIIVYLAPKALKYSATFEDTYSVCAGPEINFGNSVFLFWSATYILGPLPAIIFFNLKIFQTARSSRMARPTLTSGVEVTSQAQTSRAEDEGQRQARYSQVVKQQETNTPSSRNARTLFLFNIFFVLMWTPLVLFKLILAIFPKIEYVYGDVTKISNHAVLWIAAMNSSVNPFLWMMYTDYRRAYWQLLTRACKK